MPDDLKIKKLRSDEAKLAKELFTFFQIDDGVENPTQASEEYLTKLLERPDFHVVVAIDNGVVIGGLTAYELLKYKSETTEMFLYEINVAATHRRKGVASALIEFLKETCAEKNIKSMFVLAEADNLPAVRLYEKSDAEGFQAIEFDFEFE